MNKTVTTHKAIGETPLQAAERVRGEYGIAVDTPIAYAGRLDPMAEGKLLLLIGDECKKQSEYHNLDKEYVFEVLLGSGSDTGDVLGAIAMCESRDIEKAEIEKILKLLRGAIELPYPHFSSKTVGGKPLHQWTLEDKLDEIEIPTKKSHIYEIELENLRTISKDEVYSYATEKIETIPEVTDPKKALGEDFRRDLVRESWSAWKEDAPQSHTILTIRCVASSGTYMRTLAKIIGEKLETCGLAYSINRTKIGTFDTDAGWTKEY